MKKADQITGAVVLLFSALVIFESLRIPEQAVAAGRTNFAPVPGFLPMWAGIILAIFAIMLIVSAERRDADSAEAGVWSAGWACAAVVLLVVSVAAYIFVLEDLGYLLATFLLNVFLLRVVMRTGWTPSLVVALLASVSLYAIFQSALGVGLPKGVFGL
jgi:putative tricarboxylic transport membrane protein